MSPTVFSLPPEPIREGYKDGLFWLELENGTFETFSCTFDRLSRKAELEKERNQKIDALAQGEHLT